MAHERETPYWAEVTRTSLMARAVLLIVVNEHNYNSPDNPINGNFKGPGNNQSLGEKYQLSNENSIADKLTRFICFDPDKGTNQITHVKVGIMAWQDEESTRYWDAQKVGVASRDDRPNLENVFRAALAEIQGWDITKLTQTKTLKRLP